MNKKLALSALVASAWLTGCAAPASNSWNYPAPVSVHNDAYDITASIPCIVLMGQKTCTNFSVDVHNKTNQAIKIVWNDSALTYGGTSSPLLPDGVKYMDAEKAKPDTIIPPGATISKTFVPASNVSFSTYTHGWVTQLITPNSYTLYLQMNVNGQPKAESIVMDVKQGLAK